MYIRFVTPRFRQDYRGEAGIFHDADAACSKESQADEWLVSELREQIDWFNDQLSVPRELDIYFKRRRTLHGLCWFQAEAKECIERARYMAWLMTESGSPVRTIKSSDPGRVIWRDSNQIVAIPDGTVPRAFH